MANPYQSPSLVQSQQPGLFSGLFNFFKGNQTPVQSPQVNPAPITPNFSPVPANFNPNALRTPQLTTQNQNVGQGTSLLKQTNLGANRGQLGQSQQFTTPSGAVVTQGGQLVSAPQGLNQNNQPTQNQQQTAPSIFDSLNNITPDQMTKFRTLFGLTPNTQQQQALGQLNALYEQAKTVNAPNPVLNNLDQQIKQLQLQQANLNPTQLLKDNPSLVQGGITQRQLERETAAQGLPIAQSLSNLLVGRSALANTIGIQQQALGTQIENTQRQYGLIPSTGLPAEVGTKFLENALVPKISTHPSTQYDEATGKLYNTLVNTNQFGQVTGETRTGEGAPPAAIQEFNEAKASGKLSKDATYLDFLHAKAATTNPQIIFGESPMGKALSQGISIDPRLAGIIQRGNAGPIAGALMKDPSIISDLVNGVAAEKFFTNPSTQKFIANAKTATNTIDQIISISDQIPRSSVRPFNKVYLEGLAAAGNINAQKLLSLADVSGDDIGLLLGSGAGSDYKTKLGAAIFGPNGSAEATKALGLEIKGRIENKIQEYYKQGGQSQNTQGGNLSIQAPNGKTYIFKDQQSLDNFKKAAGL